MAQTKKGPARPFRIFMCYRRNTAETANHFYSVMEHDQKNDYGKIFCASRQRIGWLKQDLPNILSNVEWVIFFIGSEFTINFLDKREETNPYCVAAAELIAIEKERQRRQNESLAELNMLTINIDDAMLDRACALDLKHLFTNARILQDDSVGSYTELLPNVYNSSRDDLHDFIEEHIAPYCALPAAPMEESQAQDNEHSSVPKGEAAKVRSPIAQSTFKIAFSFTGEYREKNIRPVCEELLKIGYQQHEIFFDDWHSALYTGMYADSTFRKIYHDDSQCVVVLLSPNYGEKSWTGNLEWPTVRALINEGAYEKVCLLRVDDVDINKIEGLYSSRDVPKSIDNMTPPQIAQFIHRWYCIHVLKQFPDAGKPKHDSTSEKSSKPELSTGTGMKTPVLVAEAAKNNSTVKHDNAGMTLPGAEAGLRILASALETAKNDNDRIADGAKQGLQIFSNTLNAGGSVVNNGQRNNSGLTRLENGSVLFGSYPQTTEGERHPIEWLVLKKEQDRMLLLSRYVLDMKPYNVTSTETTWTECTLRKWLNGRRKDDFLQVAFTAEEQEQIMRTTVSLDREFNSNTIPRKSTEDKVFLLSIHEAYELFPSEEDRNCTPTEYANKKSTYTHESYFTEYTKDGKIACFWWLRMLGGKRNFSACVGPKGFIYENGGHNDNSQMGVRPTLWVKLK